MTLTILIWLPLAIGIVVSAFPPQWVGRATAIASLAPLGIALSFLARFKTGHAGLQFVTDRTWLSAVAIHYKLGLDGLNMALGVLTTVLFTASMVWAATREWERPRLFY